MRVVVMGVTGSGKSTIGSRLAEGLGAQFRDGDDLHTEDAIAKMAGGIPLTDEDRWPWLDAVATWLSLHDRAVVTCSALKRVYRDCIRDVAGQSVIFVHLDAPQSVLEPRVRRRAALDGHFAPAGLLDSQYAALEPLGTDEIGGAVAAGDSPPETATLAARSIVDAATETAGG